MSSCVPNIRKIWAETRLRPAAAGPAIRWVFCACEEDICSRSPLAQPSFRQVVGDLFARTVDQVLSGRASMPTQLGPSIIDLHSEFPALPPSSKHHGQKAAMKGFMDFVLLKIPPRPVQRCGVIVGSRSCRDCIITTSGYDFQKDNKSRETVALEDFAELHKAGLTHPLMDDIERLFAAAQCRTHHAG
jgi:hypothetical protein